MTTTRRPRGDHALPVVAAEPLILLVDAYGRRVGSTSTWIDVVGDARRLSSAVAAEDRRGLQVALRALRPGEATRVSFALAGDPSERRLVGSAHALMGDTPDRPRALLIMHSADDPVSAKDSSHLPFLATADGDVSDLSGDMRGFLGARAEMSGREVWEAAIHADDRGRVAALMRAAVSGPASDEVRLTRHDGRLRWVLLSPRALTTPRGDAAAIVVLCADLRACRTRARAAADPAPAAAATGDLGELAHAAAALAGALGAEVLEVRDGEIVRRGVWPEGTPPLVEGGVTGHRTHEVSRTGAPSRWVDPPSGAFLAVPLTVLEGPWCLRMFRDEDKPFTETEESWVSEYALAFAPPVPVLDERRDPPDALTRRFHALPASVCVVSSDMRYAESPGRGGGLGYESGDLVGRTIEEAQPPHVAAVTRDAVAEALRLATVADFEYSIPGRGGRRWFEGVAAPVAGDRVIVLVRDVTERTRAALERDRFLELSRDIVATVSPDGYLLRVSSAATRLLGRPPDDIVLRPFVDLIHPRDAGSATSALDQVERSGEPCEFRTRCVAMTGAAVWIDWAATLDRDSGLILLTGRDVSDRVLIEAQQAALHRLAVTVARDADAEEVFATASREAARLLDCDVGLVARFEDDRAAVMGSWSPTATEISASLPLFGDGALARVRATGEPARIENYGAVESEGGARLAREAGFSAAVAAPVIVGDRLWGAMLVAVRGGSVLGGDAEERVSRLSELMGTAIAHAEARALLEAQATTDNLTGLPNQRSFHARLSAEVGRASRHGRTLSLAIIDLDHFKQINDAHGHPVGDRVLVEVAQRLLSTTREGDLVARIGGEEFAWLMPETSAEDAWIALERARVAVCGAPITPVGTVTLSGGVCDVSEAGSSAELYRLADLALYCAKASGRNLAVRYTPESAEEISGRSRDEAVDRYRKLGSIRVLASAVDARDPSTQAHSERVAHVSGLLAEESGWTSERVVLMREAGLVHDVGKIGIPDAILFKPETLDEAEFEQVKGHAAIGAQIVSDALAPEQVAWVRGHHERFDGEGYPDALVGDAIPEGARLLALADAWDAMTSERRYSRPLTVSEALAECRRLRGRQFCPDAVAALESVLRHRPEALEPPPADAGFPPGG